ncbi:MAG: class I SAM-dependent methyltransferase [Chloroflexota bacterium]|nr:class I SAM-dependent methyltransferase [Chloroflexota bacterium]
MSHRTLFLDDRLYEYMLSVSLRQLPIQQELLDATSQLEWAGIESSPEQVQLLQLLAALIGARNCLEIGVFTGYTTLALALALPDDGCIVACDIDPRVTAVAREFWERAGVASRIDLRIAPALSTLDQLLREGRAESFDFAYIDADKLNGERYYDRVLRLLRGNGLMVIDNVFWGGLVAEPADNQPETTAVRALNQRVARDARVDLSTIPLGDGMLLARKRPEAGQR